MIQKIAFDLVSGLVVVVIEEKLKSLDFFERMRVESKVKLAVADIVKPLLPFLKKEGVQEDKQRRLIETCVDELRPLAAEPEKLFQGSLDGQKIFDDLYAKGQLPQVVIEDGLIDTYTLLFPRIATILCKIPAAVREWEVEAWVENFRRLDEIVSQMQMLFEKVDELTSVDGRHADDTLRRMRRTMLQRIGLQLDITGLRADRPTEGKFDDFFVHPEFKEIDETKASRVFKTSDSCFDHFVFSSERSVVIGAPGAGKSTWTKWLQRKVLNSQWVGICVRVELRQLVSEDLLSLQLIVQREAGSHIAPELTPTRIRQWLDNRQIIFILDGFDEIPPSQRDRVYDWIQEFSLAAEHCPFIITSRPLTTDHLSRLGKHWYHWMIEPFDADRIVDYIRRWYMFTPVLVDGNREVNADELAQGWRSDSTIGPLTGNPLLLSTLLMVHHLDGRLPNGRSQLYQRYVDGMLGLWDDRRNIVEAYVSLTKYQKRQIVCGLALHMFLGEMDQLDEPNILEWMENFIEHRNIALPATEVLSYLLERSGLLIGPGVYSFVHKTVAEYLVAEAILQGDEYDREGQRIDRFRVFEHRNDDRWRTITLLWSGLASVSDVEHLISQCIQADSPQLAYLLLSCQTERMSPAVYRRLLLEAFELTISQDLVIVLLESGSRISPRKSKQTRNLFNDFDVLVAMLNSIRFAIYEDIIVWDDYLNALEDLRMFYWVNFVHWSRDLEHFRTYLETLPAKQSKMPTLFWAIYRWIDKLLHSKRLDEIELSIKEIRSCVVDPDGLIVTVLISLIITEGIDINIIESEIQRTGGASDSYVSRRAHNLGHVLDILTRISTDRIATNWLIKTQSWYEGFSFRTTRTVDLFERFEATLEIFSKRGDIGELTTLEYAYNLLRDLQSRRTSIIETTTTSKRRAT